MIFTLFSKIFIFMFIGFLLQLFLKPKTIKNIISKLIDLNIYLFIPFFIFLNVWIYSRRFIIQSSSVLIQLIIIALSFLILGSVLSKIYSLISKMPFYEVSNSIVFMNSLYLGLPVVQFYLGENYTTIGIILGVLLTFIHLTIGVRFLLGQKKILSNLINLSSAFALIIGLIFSFLRLKVPYEFEILSNSLKKIVSPLMLTIVGYHIPLKAKFFNRAILTSVLIRLFGGFLVGILISEIFRFEKDIYCFTVIVSSMPPAVNNYILQKKFNINPEFAAENVFWGTLLGVFFIIFVGMYLRFSGILPD